MINGERVRQARELNGLTQAALARRLRLNQSAIAQLETGRTQPSEPVLEGISFQTGFPPVFFKQAASVDFPLGSLLFRARNSMTKSERSQAHQYARTIYEQYKFLSEFIKNIPVSLPRLRDSPATSAKVTRSAMGLSPDTPIKNLIRSIEKIGVVVLAIPRYLKNRDAFSAWVLRDDLDPVIVLASSSAGDRIRFSVSHELGHLVMHHSIQVDMPRLESEADQFAAEFLMPEDAMRRELSHPVTLDLLVQLKPRWKVSIQALARRAHDLDIITAGQYKYLMQQISKRGWRRAEPVSVPIERPRALRKMAELVYGVPLNYRRLANALGHPVSLVRETLEAHAGSATLLTGRNDSQSSKVHHISDYGRQIPAE
jgi:Zn-dependent peptidase ImmA (M78 family)